MTSTSRVVALIIIFGVNVVAQIAPGSGANTEDPRKILGSADEGLRGTERVTYDASIKESDASQTRTAAVLGNVYLSNLPTGYPLVATLAADRTYYQTGTDEPILFHTAFDGRTINKLVSNRLASSNA